MEKPIIFNADDVRAILDGSKTQTRRIVKLNSHYGKDFHGFRFAPHKNDLARGVFADGPYPEAPRSIELAAPPCMPADTLWVRETFQPLLADDVEYASETNYKTGKGYTVSYPATDGIEEFVDADGNIGDACWPSIHMPRWASRITLQVEAVRVERIQDITDADIIAEGEPSRTEFMWLWRHIYGYASWDDNPLVWVIEFKRIQA